MTHGMTIHNYICCFGKLVNMMIIELFRSSIDFVRVFFFFFLFCLLGVFVPLKNFSLLWGRNHFRCRAANFDLIALMAIEKCARPTVTRDIRLKWSSPRTRDTHTYCWAFNSGAVTTCFSDLALSRLGYEHPTFRLRGERCNPLHYRRDSSIELSNLLPIFMS